MIKAIIAISSTVLFASCMNSYEQKVIGSYSSTDCVLKDSTIATFFPGLILKDDKTFIIKTNKREIKGTWEADDYGDWTLIDFNLEHSPIGQQGQIVNSELIQILNPDHFIDTNFKELSFKRNH